MLFIIVEGCIVIYYLKFKVKIKNRSESFEI